jgi:hypothetical protein
VNGGKGGDRIGGKLDDQLGRQAGYDTEGKEHVQIDRKIVELVVAALLAAQPLKSRARCRIPGCDFELNECRFSVFILESEIWSNDYDGTEQLHGRETSQSFCDVS